MKKRKRNYSIRNRVHNLLKFKSDVRDDKNWLILEYWKNLQEDFPHLRDYSLERGIAEGYMDEFETLFRNSRFFQRKSFDLRGKTYNQRQIMGGQKSKYKQMQFNF